MPLDSTDFVIETNPDLSKPSLEGLSWLLRHMPSTHKWNFQEVGGPQRDGCGSAGCAYGLMLTVWGKSTIPFSERLGIPMQVEHSFFLHGEYLPALDSEVTPQMVADRIDEFLRSRNSDAYLAETRK